jgi:hypothetical protein
LKAAIAANATWRAIPNTSDGAFALALLLNATASPSFTVWKTSVLQNEVFSVLEGSALSGLTTANTNRLMVAGIYATTGLNPSSADVRFLFDDVFSATSGATTRSRLLTLWKRLATEAEKVFAVGTGSDAVPATLTVEGSLSYQDVYDARNS